MIDLSTWFGSLPDSPAYETNGPADAEATEGIDARELRAVDD